MTTASNIGYEPSGGTRAIAPGGIWAVHLLTRKVGLIQDIDWVLHLLKQNPPYYGSIGADARFEGVVLLAGFPSVGIQARTDRAAGEDARATRQRRRESECS